MDPGFDSILGLLASSREKEDNRGRQDVHIDGCEGAVRDGAAEGSGQGKAGVEVQALGLFLDSLVNGCGRGGHYETRDGL